MGKPKVLKPLTMFKDIEEVLSTILAADHFEQAEYVCDTPGQAINWKFRANQFRATIRRNQELELGLPEGMGTSPYDHLTFVSIGRKVEIKLRRAKPGALTINGQSVDPTTTSTTAAEDEEGELDDFLTDKD